MTRSGAGVSVRLSNRLGFRRTPLPHHGDRDWANDGLTDADSLFFACGIDHTLISKGILETKVTDTGRLAWSDGTGPPQINLAHHPDELLAELDDEDQD